MKLINRFALRLSFANPKRVQLVFKKYKILILIVAMVLIQIPEFATARSRSTAKGVKSEQIQALFKPLIKRVLKEPLIAKQALPLKVVMAKVMMDLNSPNANSKNVTNLVLNDIVDTSKFLVVNIDMDISNNSDLDATLIHYDSPQSAARRGLSMGALYLIGTQVKEVSLVTGQGKLKSGYEAIIWLEDLRKHKRLFSLSSTDQPIKARTRTLNQRIR